MEIPNAMSKTHDEFEGGKKGQWTAPSRDAYLDQVAAMIRDHGWAIQGVFARETSDQQWDFAYTVGLIQRGCSTELVITGIPMNAAADILNEIAASFMNAGEKIPPSEYTLKNGYTLKSVSFIPREGSDIHLGVARAYYGRADVPVTQYIWPDEEHHYPWDEGWGTGYVQPYGPTA